MNAMLWIVGGLVCLAALYLYLIAPAGAASRPDASALAGKLYAHRGLHDGNQRVVENSLEAFRLAVESGYGMELDVQPTRDGQLVVFHDAVLERVCGVKRNMIDLTYEELRAFSLPDGTPIPLLTQVLALVAGRAPLIVEVKHYGNVRQTTAKALALLEGYGGPFCMESFHPLAVLYLRRHAPHVLRGQLASGGHWNRRDTSAFSHFAMKYLLVNAVGRPHFVAYSCPGDHTLAMWLMKRVFRPLLAAWTIRDERTLQEAQKWAQMPIFERFCPHG